MKFSIKVKVAKGRTVSWMGEPDFYRLQRALEKCEIKSFEISLAPLKL